MNDIECAWVAGLLEGEGSFTFGPEGNRIGKPKIRQLMITCGMTDEDTILKLHQIVQIGNVYLERRKDPRRDYAKQMYIWQASKRADVIPFMEAIRPHMSERRGERIDAMFQYAIDNPLIYNRPVLCGTRRSYRKGCHCDECRGAMSAYHRDLAKRKRDGTYVPNARKDYATPA